MIGKDFEEMATPIFGNGSMHKFVNGTIQRNGSSFWLKHYPTDSDDIKRAELR